MELQSMNARADKPVPPDSTPPRGGNGGDMSALQNRGLPRTAGPAGKIIAADPSCSPAEA
jgi:hypothetical protein